MSVNWGSMRSQEIMVREEALPSFNIGRLVRYSMLGAALGYAFVWAGLELYAHLVHPLYLQAVKGLGLQ